MKRPPLHFLAAILILTATAALLQARPRTEVFPPRSPLSQFPSTLGGWQGTDLPIGRDVLDVLGHGDFLLRLYKSQTQAPADLFIAYFPSQRTGDTIHSPQNCLPGAGWSPIRSDRIMLSVPGHPAFPVNRYIIGKEDSRRLVLYWYWSHGRGIASEYAAKFYLVADSIRLHRSDAALIRITTELAPGENRSAGEQRILPLAEEIVPLLQNYIPN